MACYHVSGWFHYRDSRCVVWIGSYSFLINDVTNESQLAEKTFCWVESGSGFFNSLESCLETLVVFAKYKDIIHESQDTFKSRQDLWHPFMEVLRGARYSKWHFLETIATEGCDRGGEESWFFVSGIYQKPILASSFWTPLLQRAGLASHLPWRSGWTSWRTFLFKGLRCTQMHIAPSFFGTITMPAHQGVGLSTLEMTKCFHSIVHFGS